MQAKFIVVLGSVMSGLGKGVVTSSILKILNMYGYKVLPIKFDGYLNYDCGTMNPYRHGEVFVLDDTSEVDMDFGTYERFLNTNLTKDSSITGGKLFSGIIDMERTGEYLGEDVQIVPHLTGYIQKKLQDFAKRNKVDFVVIEVGGTVGDLENGYFIEALRELALNSDVAFVDVTYLPKIAVVGEQKTKPAQFAFRTLMSTGILPDFLVCRGAENLSENARKKLSVQTSLPKEYIIDDPDMKSAYMVPELLMKQNFDKLLLSKFGIHDRKIDASKLGKWKKSVDKIVVGSERMERVRIAIVGKYVDLKDSYVSVREAIIHAGAALSVEPAIEWIESETLEKRSPSEVLAGVDGIIVPGGFGKRGIEGMINAIRYARENKIPYLGLCLGMQLMSIEFARNVCGLKGANSTEFDPKTKYNVIDLMQSQVGLDKKGATMRLGAWEMKINDKGSIAYSAYRKSIVSERHRHRYEFNNAFRKPLERNGLVVSATTRDGRLVEAVEWKDSFGIATQAHPELKSRIEAPAPLFVAFVDACKRNA